MSDRTREAIRDDVIESMEQSAEAYGLSRSAGRVYGILYFSDDSLSIPELVDATGYAKSTISNVTRKLTRIGLIHRRSSEGGGRRVEFEPETDLWFVIQDVLRQYLHREITGTQRTLSRSRDRLEGLGSAEEEQVVDEARLTELEESYAELQEVLEKAMNHSIEEIIEALDEYEKKSD